MRAAAGNTVTARIPFSFGGHQPREGECRAPGCIERIDAQPKCEPRCTAASCAADQRCRSDGRCAPRMCDDGWDCSAYGTCAIGTAGADGYTNPPPPSGGEAAPPQAATGGTGGAPVVVSVNIHSDCSNTVKVFYGTKPKFGSGTYSTISSARAALETASIAIVRVSMGQRETFARTSSRSTGMARYRAVGGGLAGRSRRSGC